MGKKASWREWVALAEHSCVVDALEAVTDTWLTTEQAEERLRQLMTPLEEGRTDYDDQSELFKSIRSQTQTPAGRVLASMEIKGGEATAKEIRRIVAAGGRVIVHFKEHKELGKHAAMLVPRQGRGFLHNGDAGDEVFLREGKVHQVHVFTKK